MALGGDKPLAVTLLSFTSWLTSTFSLLCSIFFRKPERRKCLSKLRDDHHCVPIPPASGVCTSELLFQELPRTQPGEENSDDLVETVLVGIRQKGSDDASRSSKRNTRSNGTPQQPSSNHTFADGAPTTADDHLSYGKPFGTYWIRYDDFYLNYLPEGTDSHDRMHFPAKNIGQYTNFMLYGFLGTTPSPSGSLLKKMAIEARDDDGGPTWKFLSETQGVFLQKKRDVPQNILKDNDLRFNVTLDPSQNGPDVCCVQLFDSTGKLTLAPWPDDSDPAKGDFLGMVPTSTAGKSILKIQGHLPLTSSV